MLSVILSVFLAITGFFLMFVILLQRGRGGGLAEHRVPVGRQGRRVGHRSSRSAGSAVVSSAGSGAVRSAVPPPGTSSELDLRVGS